MHGSCTTGVLHEGYVNWPIFHPSSQTPNTVPSGCLPLLLFGPSRRRGWISCRAMFGTVRNMGCEMGAVTADGDKTPPRKTEDPQQGAGAGAYQLT